MDDALLENLEAYNDYVMERIKLIYDFDVWYEYTTGNAFPKEWYTYINTRGNDKP